MPHVTFDSEVLHAAVLRRVKGAKQVTFAYGALFMFGASLDLFMRVPIYLTTIFTIASIVSFMLTFFATADRIVLIERALIVVGTLIILGITFQGNVVLCLSLYLPMILFLGFVEQDTKWRNGLVLFIASCFIGSYFSMSDEFISTGSNQVISIAVVDIIVVCMLLTVVINYFARLNYFTFDLATKAAKNAEVSLSKTRRNHQELEAQKEIFLAAQQRDKQAVELHRKKRSVLRTRQEELSQFAYAASHDLKEPVRTIKSFISIVRKRLPAGLEQELDITEYFDLVSNSAGSMHRLLEGLLEYSRSISISLHAEEIPIPQTLDSILGQHKGVQYNIVTKGEKSLHFDLVAFKKVVDVIANNSLKFTDPSKEPLLTIEFSSQEAAAGNDHVTTPKGVGRAIDENVTGTTLIRFNDNGIGIPEEYRERVFGLFQRLHKREDYVGAGVGLSLARRLVDKSRGKIWIEPGKKGGTCVCVELPNYPVVEVEPE